MKKIIALFAIITVIGVIVIVYNSRKPITQTDNNNNQVEDKKGLFVNNLQENDMVSSPFKITGYVNGAGWIGFEGQVGVVNLYDNAGNVLDTKSLIATSEWMTSTIYFEANLEFFTTATSGKIVFRNENPSGEPSRDKSVSWNIKFAPVGEVMNLKAFFSNSNLDPKITCERVFPVDRTVAKTAGVSRAALEEMLKGPTSQEQAGGFASMINPGVKINSLTIDKGLAKVDFDQTIQQGVGGSCRVSMMRLQIEQTLKQFPTVKNVVISVEGKTEDVLQP